MVLEKENSNVALVMGKVVELVQVMALEEQVGGCWMQFFVAEAVLVVV